MLLKAFGRLNDHAEHPLLTGWKYFVISDIVIIVIDTDSFNLDFVRIENIK